MIIVMVRSPQVDQRPANLRSIVSRPRSPGAPPERPSPLRVSRSLQPLRRCVPSLRPKASTRMLSQRTCRLISCRRARRWVSRRKRCPLRSTRTSNSSPRTPSATRLARAPARARPPLTTACPQPLRHLFPPPNRARVRPPVSSRCRSCIRLSSTRTRSRIWLAERTRSRFTPRHSRPRRRPRAPGRP